MPSPVSKGRRLAKKSVLDESSILPDFEILDINPKNATKIWRHVIQQNVEHIELIPEVPKQASILLAKDYKMITSKVIKRSDASDGSTTKLMIELQDGMCVEAVIMRYGHVELDCFPEEEKKKKNLFLEGNSENSRQFRSNKRATLCVSSQVGCAMGCTFCATGTMGLMANLTAGEILEQVYHANKIEKIKGIVFMGMGEPLDNYDAVITAIKGMTDTSRFGISPHRISISTVGVVPRIVSLIRDAPEIGFALSLHAPTQELRIQIVPTAKAWNIHKIMDATMRFIDNQNKNSLQKRKRRHILIEYVLISDINDTEMVAHQLGKLLHEKDVLLNLIPYNPTLVPFNYKAPTEEAKKKFVDIVRNDYGIHTMLRQTMGQDIDGACGQLVISNTINGASSNTSKSCNNDDPAAIIDLEDLLQTTNSTSAQRNPTPKKLQRNRKSFFKLESIVLSLIVVLVSLLIYKMTRTE